MNITSNYSTSSISSVSELLSAYHSTVVTGSVSTSSTQDTVEISAAGQAALSQSAPPDFNNMSMDEFKDHLTEMQTTLSSYGYEATFDLDSISDEELSELKDSMAAQGKGGKQPPPPPPPPPPSSTAEPPTTYSSDLWNIISDSTTSTSTYETLEEMIALYSSVK